MLTQMARSRLNRRRRGRRPARTALRLAGGACATAALIGLAGAAQANTSHAGWPPILRQNEQINRTSANATMRGKLGVHNELLGGNGNDTIYAGNIGDVLWGDYMPGNQSTTQVDKMYGGAGNDFFYASHGKNYIYTGGGTNVVHAHYGSGTITCGSSTDIVYLSHKSRPHYKLIGCKHISYATQGS
jgi:Ca2+-binding RTX toxin-like protein